MIVIYKNELYQLDMSFMLFESLKRCNHNHQIEIEQLTSSTYKKHETVSISECEDYSIARNLQALAH